MNTDIGCYFWLVFYSFVSYILVGALFSMMGLTRVFSFFLSKMVSPPNVYLPLPSTAPRGSADSGPWWPAASGLWALVPGPCPLWLNICTSKAINTQAKANQWEINERVMIGEIFPKSSSYCILNRARNTRPKPHPILTIASSHRY